MLVICLWPMTGQTAQRSLTTEEFYSANARYTHSRHYRSSVRHRHSRRSHSNPVRDTDNPVRHTLAQGTEFTDKKAPVLFPFTTGTTILNRYGRWYRGVSEVQCVNPWDDMRFLLILDTFATY